MGEFAGSIGKGIGGLVGGSIDALSDAFDTIVTDLQGLLPGPLFPITMIAIAVLFLWWLFRK